MNDGRVVSNFILQALRNEPITVYGDGSQTRSFCYVDDMVDGMIKMMDQNEISGPINLGNPSEYKILELAEKIIEMTRSNSKIIFKSLPLDDPEQRQPDISLAKEKLIWKPIIELDEGKLYSYKGNYAYYLEKRDARITNEEVETGKAKQLFKNSSLNTVFKQFPSCKCRDSLSRYCYLFSSFRVKSLTSRTIAGLK